MYSPGSAAYCPSYKMTTAQTPAHRINSSKLYRNYLAKESLDPGPIYNYYAPGDISNPDKLKKAVLSTFKIIYFTFIYIYIYSQELGLTI